ncbi:MAG: DNA polymerase III subunit chi [Zoogloeaceae bacterium]|nr:DNA polymerase III subunit chi [Zoogloeaceae bacterium]
MRVQFYHNTEDPLALACELIARAHAGGRQVALRLPDANTARRADQMLWTGDPLTFIPHVAAGSLLAAETPVILAEAGSDPAWPHADMLFNLASDIPPGFSGFRMLVEIIGKDEVLRAPARSRWMEYKRQGHELQAFDSEQRRAM